MIEDQQVTGRCNLGRTKIYEPHISTTEQRRAEDCRGIKASNLNYDILTEEATQNYPSDLQANLRII